MVPAPYSIWRRMAVAEARQVELDLDEAAAAGSPYPDNPAYQFHGYLDAAHLELDRATAATAAKWPRGRRQVGYFFGELVRVWTGSEHETAIAALHRAEGLLLMVQPAANLQSEALKMQAIFNDTNDIPPGDPRHAVYAALFKRIEAAGLASVPAPAKPLPGLPANRPPGPPEGTSAPCQTEMADRVMLRELRRTQHESWEIARSRIRIFRNILAGIIPFLTLVLIGVAMVSWGNPALISLRSKPDGADVAVVVFLGAFGGLLSAVASVRALRNFQRFYGLPLAQSILKIPAGAATALAGIILLQHGLLGINPVSWDMVIPYALAFGVAQIAVTRRIDSRASDLLGDANNKSPSTAQTASASVPSGDIA